MKIYEEYLLQSSFALDANEHYDAYTETPNIDSHTEHSDVHDDVE